MQRDCFRRIGIALLMSATIVALAGTWGITQTTAPSATQEAKIDPKINEPFKKPDLKAFIKKFESDDREPYAKRNEIVAALGLKPGMSVADVGAGTGFFTRLFAEKVGDTGKGLCGRYCAAVSGTYRGRIKKTRADPGRDRAGRPKWDQSPDGIGRPGVSERRLPPSGKARESAFLDASGTQSRWKVGGHRFR